MSVSLSFYVIVCIKNVAVLWDKRKKSESSTLITLVNTINFFYIISSIWFYSWYYFRLVDIILLFFKVSFKHVCFKLSECIDYFVRRPMYCLMLLFKIFDRVHFILQLMVNLYWFNETKQNVVILFHPLRTILLN